MGDSTLRSEVWLIDRKRLSWLQERFLEMRYKNCQCLLFVREVIVLGMPRKAIGAYLIFDFAIAHCQWGMGNGQWANDIVPHIVPHCTVQYMNSIWAPYEDRFLFYSKASYRIRLKLHVANESMLRKRDLTFEHDYNDLQMSVTTVI